MNRTIYNIIVFMLSVLSAIVVGVILVGITLLVVGSTFTIEQQTNNIFLTIALIMMGMITGVSMMTAGFWVYDEFSKEWWQ